MSTLSSEMAYMLGLCPTADVTHQAIASGSWSDSTIWNDGTVPGNKAKVWIPEGITVTYDDGATGPNLMWLLIDGIFQFSDMSDQNLMVETIVVSMMGCFNIGDTTAPYQHKVTVTFSDNGPIADVQKMSRGLLCSGCLCIYGKPIVTWAKVVTNPAAGDTTITIDGVMDWVRGQTIIIPDTVAQGYNDEVVTISKVQVNGKTTTIAFTPALAHNHNIVADPSNKIPVAVQNRNIIFTSEATQIDRFGHVMQMHSTDAHVNYAAFLHLGRTNKSIPIDDVSNFRQDGWQDSATVTGTGTNIRGRYSLHFHRCTTAVGVEVTSTTVDPTITPASVVGCYAEDSPGWAFVNHSSFVVFDQCVAYKIDGASFVAEIGNELGTFSNDLSIRNDGGRGIGVSAWLDLNTIAAPGGFDSFGLHVLLVDWGSAVGFSFAGAGVRVKNCISCQAYDSGFFWIVEATAIHQPGDLGDVYIDKRVLADDFPASEVEADGVSVLCYKAPLTECDGLEAFACNNGFHTYVLTPIVTPHGTNVVANMTVWNTQEDAFNPAYSDYLTLLNPKAFHGTSGSVGINQAGFPGEHLTVINPTITGWFAGISMGHLEGDSLTVTGNCVWGNTYDLMLDGPYAGRVLDYSGCTPQPNVQGTP